jgi:hypothetical protein
MIEKWNISKGEDIVISEHAIEMQKLITTSELAIIPGVRGEYIEKIITLKYHSKEADFVIPMVKNFLNKSETKEQ